MLQRVSCCTVNLKHSFLLFLILGASKFSISCCHCIRMQSVPHVTLSPATPFPPFSSPLDMLALRRPHTSGKEGNEHSFIKVTRLQRTGTWVPYQPAKLKIAGECEEHNCVTGRNWKMWLFGGIQLRNWVRRSPSSYQVLKVVRYFPLRFPHPGWQKYPYYLPSLCLWFQSKQTLTQQLWLAGAPQQFKGALL